MTIEITPTDLYKLHLLLSLVDDQSRPNMNVLNEIVRDVRLLNLNMKALGYDVARRLADALPLPEASTAQAMNLPWKASTQADMEADWVAHWCRELRVPRVFHRKLWELAYVLQAFHDVGLIREGTRGLGFGCGVEPLPSYLAAHGVAVTMTDLPSQEAFEKGWAETNQYAQSRDQAFHPGLVDRAAFDRLVDLRVADMNAIPADLTDYDFCWSVCALEHLGSIDQGLRFIERALNTLKPGGIAVHTTEFNIEADGPTIDNWTTVLFQRRHFEALAERLRAAGHHVAGLDFDVGDKVMDRFIDLPPWPHNMPDNLNGMLGAPAHLKIATDGFVATCFGLVVRKAG